MFNGPVAVAAALTGLATGLATAYGVWVRWGHLWRSGTVKILESHISRLCEELKLARVHLTQKQEAIDELYETNFRCELNEEAVYGWIVRAIERITRDTERLRAAGVEPEPPLEPPPRRPAAEKARNTAAYLRRRERHHDELAELAAEALAAMRATNQSAPPEEEEPRTY